MKFVPESLYEAFEKKDKDIKREVLLNPHLQNIRTAEDLIDSLKKDLYVPDWKIEEIIYHLKTTHELYLLKTNYDFPQKLNKIEEIFQKINIEKVLNHIKIENQSDFRYLIYADIEIPEKYTKNLSASELLNLSEIDKKAKYLIQSLDKFLKNKEQIPWQQIKGIISKSGLHDKFKEIKEVTDYIKSNIIQNISENERLVAGIIIEDISIIKEAIENGAEFENKYNHFYRTAPMKIKKILVKNGMDSILAQRGWQTYNVLKFINIYGKEGVHFRKIKEFMHNSEYGEGEWQKMENYWRSQDFYPGTPGQFNPPSKFTDRREEKGKRRYYYVNDLGKQFIKRFESKMKSNNMVESLNEWKTTKGIKAAAGLVIIQNNKMLLVHPTNSPWLGTYSIPKGGLDKKEDPLKAALRETWEETGIKIKRKHISTKDAGFIDYTTKKGKIYKRVYYFVAYPKKEITEDMFQPQMKEVDWAGFLSRDEAKKRIFGRFKPLLKFLK